MIEFHAEVLLYKFVVLYCEKLTAIFHVKMPSSTTTPPPEHNEFENSDFLLVSTSTTNDGSFAGDGWLDLDNPRMNRSVSCVELPRDKKLNNGETPPPIPETPIPSRPKSENIFLEIGHVFSRGNSRKRNKNLKLNLSLVNGQTNPLRASKSNLDLSRLSASVAHEDTITPDFPLFKKSPTKKSQGSTSTTPTPSTEGTSLFGLKKRIEQKNRKNSKGLLSSPSRKKEV
jgi:hypothetical protein